MTKLLSRSALLSAKLPFRDIPVPEMGEDVTVRVQQMSVNTRAAFFERIRQQHQAVLAYEDDQQLPVKRRKNVAKPADLDTAVLAIVHSIADEDGKLMFVEADIPLFDTWAHNAVTRIYQAVNEINDYDSSTNKAIDSEKKG